MLVGGGSNPKLTKEVANYLGTNLADSKITKFGDGETFVSINSYIRGKEVYIIQPTCKPVNDNLMELLLMISACKRGSCKSLTVFIPY